MAEAPQDAGSQFERVIADIRTVAGAAVQQKKQEGDPIRIDALRDRLDRDFAFDFDDYLTFLSKAECLDIDEGGEELKLHERITLAIKTPDQWADLVRENFARVTDVDVSFADTEMSESDSSGTKTSSRVPSPDQVGAPEREENQEAAASENDESSSDWSRAIAARKEDDGAGSTDEAGGSPGRDRSETDDDRSASSTARRYDRLDEIGSGGFGTAYRARDAALDRTVAIKEIRNIFDVFAQLDADEIAGRFEDLTRAQARLSHPGIIEVHDLDTSGTFPFAVTEFAPKGSLRRFIDHDGARNLQTAFEYFIQVLHGLRAAHEKGLVHGNVKPENVLLDEHGNAKLSDFGLTNLVGADDTDQQVYIGVSQIEYKPPEQLKNRRAASVRGDIYSLGILLYEMLTGEVPGRRSPAPSETAPEIPEAVDGFFERMATDDPGRRYESVEQVLVDFYSADAVVETLDRRSGVVFLDDPLEGRGKPEARDQTAAEAERQRHEQFDRRS